MTHKGFVDGRCVRLPTVWPRDATVPKYEAATDNLHCALGGGIGISINSGGRGGRNAPGRTSTHTVGGRGG